MVQQPKRQSGTLSRDCFLQGSGSSISLFFFLKSLMISCLAFGQQQYFSCIAPCIASYIGLTRLQMCTRQKINKNCTFPHFVIGCNCNGHSERCHFDLQRYITTGQVSGGVCDDCRNNRIGVECELCKPYYYQDPLRSLNDPYACIRECV